ncbi:MAG TPA: hypothetical protein VFG75_08330 [Gaiella sp.]|jgi:hypothetical protein|nr:hypothetical protein [Gaiella sp.]
MKRLLLGLALAGLLLPAAATAGGFATVQLSSLPAGTDAGWTWVPTMTILQHGVTPLDGLQPAVRITDESGEIRSFAARPAGDPGKYVADVEFPTAGTWRYEIWDGFSQTHTYSPVTIGDGGGGSFPTVPVTAGVLAAIALAGALLLALRRRRPGARPVLG